MTSPAEPSFEEFVVASSTRLYSLAVLLCGHDRAEAEDLLQSVLERAFRRWSRICRGGDPDSYVRQMLANAAVDRWRRLRRRPERPVLDRGAAGQPVPDGAGLVEDRDLLLRALASLPARQRAVIVLRYLEDLSLAQTAAVLGCSEGTVKSQASRALARLRELAGPNLASTDLASADLARHKTTTTTRAATGEEGHR